MESPREEEQWLTQRRAAALFWPLLSCTEQRSFLAFQKTFAVHSKDNLIPSTPGSATWPRMCLAPRAFVLRLTAHQPSTVMALTGHTLTAQVSPTRVY